MQIVGGVIGYVQGNDTTDQKNSKAAYKNKEKLLMLDRLTENPDNITQPSRDKMIQMFHNAWDEVYTKIDYVDTYKKTVMTLPFEGSEDHLASKKLMDLIGKEMLTFREELTKSQPVSTLKG